MRGFMITQRMGDLAMFFWKFRWCSLLYPCIYPFSLFVFFLPFFLLFPIPYIYKRVNILLLYFCHWLFPNLLYFILISPIIRSCPIQYWHRVFLSHLPFNAVYFISFIKWPVHHEYVGRIFMKYGLLTSTSRYLVISALHFGQLSRDKNMNL